MIGRGAKQRRALFSLRPADRTLCYHYFHPVMEKSESVLQLLGLSSEFGTLILIATFALALVPYLSGSDFGLLKIPSLARPIRSRLKLLGPLFFCLAVVLHIPFIPGTAPDTSIPPSTGDTARGSSTDVRAKPRTIPQMHRPQADVTPMTSTVPITETRANVGEPSNRALIRWHVHVQIPTSMTSAEVRVDGQTAKVVSRVASIITIEIPADDGAHEFRIDSRGKNPCVTTQSVQQNNAVIQPCQA